MPCRIRKNIAIEMDRYKYIVDGVILEQEIFNSFWSIKSKTFYLEKITATCITNRYKFLGNIYITKWACLCLNNFSVSIFLKTSWSGINLHLSVILMLTWKCCRSCNFIANLCLEPYLIKIIITFCCYL